MRFIREHTKIIFLLVLPVYLFIVQSTIYNRHSHFFANGMVITHSHPFDHHKKEANKHNHTEKEICFYAAMNSDYYQPESETEIHQLVRKLVFQIKTANENPPPVRYSDQFRLRGPPFFYIG